MSALVDQIVPDLGTIAEAEVIEVLVKPGDTVAVEAGLVTLETEKATMDVPATVSGVVREVLVRRGQKVASGTPVARLEGRRRCGAAPGGPAVAAAAPRRRRAGRARDHRTGPHLDHRRRFRRATRHRGCRFVQRLLADLQVPLVVLGPVPAATRPRSALRISACRCCSSSAGRRWAACASTSAAFRPRRCCTRPRSSTRRRRWPRTASASAHPRSTSTACAAGRTRSSAG